MTSTVPSLLGPKRLQEIMDRHGVRPRRSWGQNFVIDPNTIRKVVNAAGITPDERVLEVGAGAGSLTLALASAARHVTAIEVDQRLVPVLNEVLEGATNVDVVEGDALEVDLAVFRATKLVANLPYNVATPVVLRTLELAPGISELIVMTQKEVGERLAAVPGSKVYGAPTVAAGFFATVRVVASISRRAFWPVPNVDSVLVGLTRRGDDPGVDYGAFSRLVRAAFAQRRKSVRNSLAGVFGSTERAESVLFAVGIDPGARPESLGVEHFVDLTRAQETD